MNKTTKQCGLTVQTRLWNLTSSLAESSQDALLSHKRNISVSRLDIAGGILAEQDFAPNLDINVNILANSQDLSYQRILNWLGGARTQQQPP